MFRSFGLVLGLLNTPRVVVHEGGKSRRVVTTLFIVPHRDLAYQLVEWIERLASAFGTSGGLSSIVQVVVRGSNKTLGTTIEEIKETPPHILIGTPQGLLEIYREDEDALQLWTLSTVVVDEVDYLVETAARKEAGKSFHKAYEKAVRKVQLHPGPTREILDVIYGKEEERKERAQLIMTSATLRVHLKDYLFEESGWLDADNLVKIVGGKTEAKEVTHSILIATGVREEKTESRLRHARLQVPTDRCACRDQCECGGDNRDGICGGCGGDGVAGGAGECGGATGGGGSAVAGRRCRGTGCSARSSG